jgi:hypothetical protein
VLGSLVIGLRNRFRAYARELRRLCNEQPTDAEGNPISLRYSVVRRLHLWNQIEADVMAETLTPSLRLEAPAIGAVVLAGLGTDLFASLDDALAVVLELAPPVAPDPAETAAYIDLRQHWELVRGNVFPAFAI